ncbi:hypothetical protein KUCAC02_031486 [Chaenocephalus aceratus]|nr:hypothetical protein KUCAC02_031486 [Chaenocephalus aceratus]
MADRTPSPAQRTAAWLNAPPLLLRGQQHGSPYPLSCSEDSSMAERTPSPCSEDSSMADRTPSPAQRTAAWLTVPPLLLRGQQHG